MWNPWVMNQTLTIIIYILNFISIMLILFFERKKPEAAFSWILLLLFFPVIGFVLYLLFGQTIATRLRKKVRLKPKFDASFNRMLYEQLKLFDSASFDLKDTNMLQYLDLIKLNLKQNAALYSQDNAIKIFTSAHDKYETLLNDINNAKETINILYFIIRNDNIGKQLIDSLTKKAKEGVSVRLCYDEVGSFFTKKRLFQPLIKAGGKVRKFSFSFLGIKTQTNFRNHRKIVVIDGKIGYLGGINIGDEYMGLGRLRPWRDTHLRIVGSAVKMLQLRFFLDWLYINHDDDLLNQEEDLRLHFPEIETESKGLSGVQIVSSGPDSLEDEIKNGYMKMINSAKDTILIQTPYFVPDDAFFHSIKIASLSGVKIKVMLPGKPDKMFVYFATLSYASDLLEYGVEVYLYNGFIHSKTIVIDSAVSSIGTTNFDARSFALNYEINAFIYDTNLGIKNTQIFEEDLNECRELTLEEIRKMSKVKKLMSAIMRLFTPLL